MRLSDFSYSLPEELIAQDAVEPRSYARMMVVPGSGPFSHARFYRLPGLLRKGDVLVVNDTRVLHNKLLGQKDTGAHVEVIIEERLDAHTVKCRIKGTSHVKPGNVLLFTLAGKRFSGQVTHKSEYFHLRLSVPVDTVLDRGMLPNPPYIHERISDSNYQTVYAEEKGSLAAPTAGLHFTDHLLSTVRKKDVAIVPITLHVGFGTFSPVRDEYITGHKMHPERYTITPEAADAINHAKRLFVVGTTALKALESTSVSGRVMPGSQESTLFIYPGHRFRLHYTALITNFHLPRSSLLLLVSAFAGRERILDAYAEAVRRRYRFFSLGDAMLLYRPRP